MSKIIDTNHYFWVNGFDLSSYADQVTVNYGSEMQDITTFGLQTRTFKGGLKTWSINVNFKYDNSTAGPEASLFALVGTTSCVEVRPVNACTSVNNPSYSGIATLDGIPQQGQVGTVITIASNFVASGALSRASSS